MFRKQRQYLSATIVTVRLRIISFRKSIANEGKETVHAAKILVRLMKEKPVSEHELEFLKQQSLDMGKILALIGLQAIPGSSVAVIALERIARKHGFSLFPTSQDMPPEEPTGIGPPPSGD